MIEWTIVHHKQLFPTRPVIDTVENEEGWKVSSQANRVLTRCFMVLAQYSNELGTVNSGHITRSHTRSGVINGALVVR